jgi:hypothetical protein
MVQDLSFIHEKITEEDEQRIRVAIEHQCYKAIHMYLTQLADLMDDGNLPDLTSEQLRAMAEVMGTRAQNNE